jgi:CheY-like chemotaxis protein
MSALRNVLVVDDDPVVGKSIDRVLTGKGYVVITAKNGREAMDKLKGANVDLVFTDLKMPGMSGLEVTENVKARKPWVPVVIVTGYGTEVNEERAMAAGASDFLRKPLSPDMIEESAARALRDVPTAHAEGAEAAAPAALETTAAPEAAAAEPKASLLKNMALFLSAPFVGGLYALLLPFVGLGMLAWFGARKLAQAARKHDVPRFAGFALSAAVAPLVALAFVVVFPFAGLAVLAWMGGKAAFGRRTE